MHARSLNTTRLIMLFCLARQSTAQEHAVFPESQPPLYVPPLPPPAPPPAHSSSSGSILSRAFQSLTHALDPVPSGFDAHVDARPETLPGSLSNDSPSPVTNHANDAEQELDPSVPGGRAPIGAWAWANYTRPAEEIWPQCSSLPNCLKFSGEQGCEKWKTIANYPVFKNTLCWRGIGSLIMT